ncbi:hypothetical protein Xedl_02853 [Xenorhabdus eapokensis]|uniref:Uncharacterized protein n=1 Tax=Xenorhabdus eapokensis TaxID=1873482 RepID=A0A1Q5TMX7_9GAMM|nr:hypothetical protein Xedl_02853 [Xenorhabdus eapokensis]
MPPDSFYAVATSVHPDGQPQSTLFPSSATALNSNDLFTYFYHPLCPLLNLFKLNSCHLWRGCLFNIYEDLGIYRVQLRPAIEK